MSATEWHAGPVTHRARRRGSAGDCDGPSLSGSLLAPPLLAQQAVLRVTPGSRAEPDTEARLTATERRAATAGPGQTEPDVRPPLPGPSHAAGPTWNESCRQAGERFRSTAVPLYMPGSAGFRRGRFRTASRSLPLPYSHCSTTGRLGPARQVVTSPSTDSDRSPLPYRVSPMIATGFSYDQSEAQLALSLTCILRCQSRGQRASARVSGFKSRVKFTEVAGAA